MIVSDKSTNIQQFRTTPAPQKRTLRRQIAVRMSEPNSISENFTLKQQAL
jgi:hypothetical protein